MRKTVHRVVCDNCHDNKVTRINRAGGMRAVIKLARSKGWTIGKTDICISCKTRSDLGRHLYKEYLNQ